MHRLMLLRHAKAVPAVPGESDRSRPLAADGREDAAKLGLAMTEGHLRPDRVLVSPALRTEETWALVSGRLSQPAPTERTDELYDASAAAIRELVRRKGGDARALLIIAHNPGLQELANTLLAEGEVEARARIGNFPPAALAVLDFDAASWGEIAPGTGRLATLLLPSRLRTQKAS